MIRPQAIEAIPAEEPDLKDRSMRVIEYAMAIVALATAGILAFLR